MARIADAVVAGFGKSRALTEQSLAPLQRLQQEGVLRRIVCVTWDSPDIDAYAQWIGDLAGVSLIRVPPPAIEGTPNQRGIVYQIETLRAGLAALSGDTELVLKARPDFIFDADFLKRKIETFDTWSRIPAQSALGIKMPVASLQNKIWIPWADTNQPFYYEDAVFFGTKRDVQRMVTTLTSKDKEILQDDFCGSLVHVVRYARMFLTNYPFFSRYLSEYRYFVNDMDYRYKLVPFLLHNGFFWHLLIAHAWILHSHFHVDAGTTGELRFYSNRLNPNGDWSKPDSLNLANPYDNLDTWRAGTQAGLMMPNVGRLYGRVIDDEWQRAIFTQALPDFPQGTFLSILGNIAACGDGRLSEIEHDFYMALAKFHRENWTKAQR